MIYLLGTYIFYAMSNMYANLFTSWRKPHRLREEVMNFFPAPQTRLSQKKFTLPSDVRPLLKVAKRMIPKSFSAQENSDRNETRYLMLTREMYSYIDYSEGQLALINFLSRG